MRTRFITSMLLTLTIVFAALAVSAAPRTKDRHVEQTAGSVQCSQSRLCDPALESDAGQSRLHVERRSEDQRVANDGDRRGERFLATTVRLPERSARSEPRSTQREREIFNASVCRGIRSGPLPGG